MNHLGYVLFYYLFDFIKLWLVCWGILGMTAVKNKWFYGAIGILEWIMLLATSMYYDSDRDLLVMFYALMVILTVCVLFQGKLFKKLAYALLGYLFIIFLDVSFMAVITLVFNLSYFNLLNDGILRNIGNASNIITLFLIILIRKRKKFAKKQFQISKRVYVLLFSGIGIGIIIISTVMASSLRITTDTTRKVMLFIVIVICISYSVACLMIVIITDSRDNFKKLSMINQSIIEAQQQYYIMVNEKQQEMHSIRHEMKNHLACISNLYYANKLSEMEHYINQLVESACTTEYLLDTGNDIVNAILNDAQSRYRSENIQIRLQGGFPMELFIAPMDLCVIFANIVTNAVDAIQMMKHRSRMSYIDVDIKSFKDDLYIYVSNPTDREVVIETRELITSKADKNYHGFGTKNIRQRVEKYQGEVLFRCENHVFYVEIQMKNK